MKQCSRGHVHRLILTSALVALVGFGPAFAQGIAVSSVGKAAPLDQTSLQSPQFLAQQWKDASSKYDARRSRVLADVDRIGHEGKFEPDWQSLSQYQVPEWYKDAKFGIFIHWGVYSVPAFGSEWYPRNMYISGSPENKHQVETYGPLTQFGYKNFISMFKAEHYDPAAWARLFHESGAKYVVPVFEHHDGFAMYDSDLSDWTAAKMGPKRDVVGELAKAVRAEGMHLGASSHRIEHDWFMDGGRKIPSDVDDPKYAAFYGPAETRYQDYVHGNDLNDLVQDWTYVSPDYARDWLARTAEIVEKYHPDLIYFDWWIGQASIRPYLAQFAAYYYNESQKTGTVGVVNYKMFAMQKSSGVLDIERGQLAGIRPTYWQTDTSVSNKSWGYIQNDTFKSPAFIVHELADVVSKNGNLLLNIGPRADGTIPEEVQQVLLSVGKWLKINGDSIYGTRPWKLYGEGPTKVEEGAFHDTAVQSYRPEDFRFTTKGKDLFAIEMSKPLSSEIVIRSLALPGVLSGQQVQAVSLLGSDDKLTYKMQQDGLHINVLPLKGDEPAYVYRISLAG